MLQTAQMLLMEEVDIFQIKEFDFSPSDYLLKATMGGP